MQNKIIPLIIGMLVATNNVFAIDAANGTTQPPTNRFGITTNKMEGLTILECIHILNEYTSFKINCEIPSRFAPPDKHVEHPPVEYDQVAMCGCNETVVYPSINLAHDHNIDLDVVDKTSSFATVSAVFQQDPDFSIARNGDLISVVWKKLPRGQDYVLNKTIPSFSINNGDLLEIFRQLIHIVPTIDVYHPFRIVNTNELFITTAGRQQCGGRRVSLSLTNSTVREILNEIATVQSNMYWTAEYSVFEGTNRVMISFYATSEHAGSQVLVSYDPWGQQRLRQDIERFHKEWEQKQASQPK